MKYITNTLKYIRSNPMLWVAYAVAAVCFLGIVDVWSIHDVITSYSGGKFSASLTDWVSFFTPLNTTSWWTILTSLAAYVVLILDLAFICASADRHMRYNSLSPKGIFSSLNNNLLPCLIAVLVLLVFGCVNAFILAGIMMATTLSSYLYILGLILCAGLALIEFYVITFFALWLPCFNITGFRAYESLSYAYSLGAQRRKPLFLSIFIPTIIIAACIIALTFVNIFAVSLLVISLLIALMFVYVSVLAYVVYIDADGITREDLKKF